MSKKVLVEIFVPASAQKYDVYIPLHCKMSEVTRMVSKALSELSENRYKATDDSVLCNADTGIIYNVNMKVSEQEIQNGTRLMLI